MAFLLLPPDLLYIFINELSITEASRLMITNKYLLKIVKDYYNDTRKTIKWKISSVFITFPSLRIIDISHNELVVNADIQYLKNIHTLTMYHNFGVSSSMLLKQLNLIKFSIQNDHHITSYAIKYMVNLEELYIHNCSKITDDTFYNLTKLKKLNIYNLNELTDNAFKNLRNLEELEMTFGSISDIGICYLQNINKIKLLSCYHIKCINFDKLPKLNYLSLAMYRIPNESLIYLKSITYICLYGCNIDGSTLHSLVNIQNLSIYECPIIDTHLDNLYSLKNIQKIYIYRCPLITSMKIKELKTKFQDCLKTDIN